MVSLHEDDDALGQDSPIHQDLAHFWVFAKRASEFPGHLQPEPVEYLRQFDSRVVRNLVEVYGISDNLEDREHECAADC